MQQRTNHEKEDERQEDCERCCAASDYNGPLRLLRLGLVLVTYFLLYLGYARGLNLYVAPPRHVPVPDPQLFTYRYDPQCRNSSEGQAVMAFVDGDCPAAAGRQRVWDTGCEYRYMATAPWAGMTLALVILAPVWALVMIWAEVCFACDRRNTGCRCFGPSFYAGGLWPQLVLAISLGAIAWTVLAAPALALCRPADLYVGYSHEVDVLAHGCGRPLTTLHDYRWALALRERCDNLVLEDRAREGDPTLVVPLQESDAVVREVDGFRALVRLLFWILLGVSAAQLVACAECRCRLVFDANRASVNDPHKPLLPSAPSSGSASAPPLADA